MPEMSEESEKKFADQVSEIARAIVSVDIRADALAFACVEAGCRIAFIEGQGELFIKVLRNAADALERRISN